MSYEPGYSDFRDVIVADGKWTEQEFGDYLASRDTEVARAAKVEALRDFAESHLYDGDRDAPLPGYTKAMQVADRIETGEIP